VKNITREFLIALFLAVSSISLATVTDEPSVKASINRKRIFIGDRIRYKVEIASKYTLDVEFPPFKDNKIDECEIKDSGKALRKAGLFAATRAYIYWFDVTSYYVGKRKIPSIEIKYRETGEGNWRTLKTGELPFTVESALPRGVKLYDIKDIKGVIYPFSFLKFLMWAAIAFIVLWFIYIILKKFKKKPLPKLPFEIALEELRRAQEALSSNGDIKEYYVSISDAVRRYIEASFALRAPEMTTQEFLASLGDSSKLSGAYKELLKAFMEACDMVKFAKHAPSRAEIDSVFMSAKKFIEETKDIHSPIDSLTNDKIQMS
jgi:hypothetical protein